MQWFENLRLTHKSLLLVLLTNALVSLIALYCLDGLTKTHDALEVYRRHDEGALSVLETAMMGAMIGHETAAAFLDDPVDVQRRLQSIRAHDALAMESHARFKAHVANDEIMELSLQTDDLYFAYRDAQNEALDHLAAGRGQEAMQSYWRSADILDSGQMQILVTQMASGQREAARQAYEDASDLFAEIRRNAALFATLVLVVVVGLILWFSRRITRPIVQVVRSAERIAAGDLREKLESHTTDETGQLLAAMSTMTANLSGMIAEIRAAAISLGQISQEVSSTAHALSLGATQQLAVGTEVVTLTEEVAASISRNAERSRSCESLAAQMARDAREFVDLTRSSDDLAGGSRELLQRLLPAVRMTAELVQEVSFASQEQAEKVRKLGGTLGQADFAMRQNVAASEEMATASEELAAQAEMLRHIVDAFQFEHAVESNPGGGGPDASAPDAEDDAAEAAAYRSF